MEFLFDFFCGEAAEVERKIAQNIPFTRRCFHHFHFFGFLSSLSSPHIYLYMLASKTMWVSFTIITSHVSSAGSPNSLSQEGRKSLRVPSVHIFHFLSCFSVFFISEEWARASCATFPYFRVIDMCCSVSYRILVLVCIGFRRSKTADILYVCLFEMYKARWELPHLAAGWCCGRMLSEQSF